ncbi:hypothetical protein D8674_038993 [Pyrus ussuriensis x Pyrus communis]|uniref:Uncharacterized protein n=1 Tax=Pyrus ussuriensis x Pyrus communis TaxID=2448454 RepID=A0A5N5GXF1_9ROSA|nr:hypothetical protein D8674_039045 [Pyrus ussuriensis x Pyrus communis]KAB2620296.1 hypothetical protein D8674_038993 [Pyrus ussuriensis x Pyrus communis]
MTSINLSHSSTLQKNPKFEWHGSLSLSFKLSRSLVIPDGNKRKILESHDNENNLVVVKYGENLISNGNENFGANGHECNEHSDRVNSSVVIPHILFRDEIIDIEVKQVGFGQIATRFLEKDEVPNCISRIWCQWLGKMTTSNGLLKVPEHDFVVVTFNYNIDLGRKGLLDDVKLLLSSSHTEETENGECSSSKRKKFFSDPEDISESLSNQFDSCGEDLSAS